jgi:hypothetical protein
VEDGVLWRRALFACGAKRQQDEVGAVAHGDAVGDGLAWVLYVSRSFAASVISLRLFVYADGLISWSTSRMARS